MMPNAPKIDAANISLNCGPPKNARIDKANGMLRRSAIPIENPFLFLIIKTISANQRASPTHFDQFEMCSIVKGDINNSDLALL